MKLVFPPFLKAKKQFSNADDQRTKQVANARIHVGRVIDRMKDFDIMKAELPLEMFDVFWAPESHMSAHLEYVPTLQVGKHNTCTPSASNKYLL